MIARTSASHPLRVDWLPVTWPGKVGLTFAPGKKQPTPMSGDAWDRDLVADVRRLVSEFGTRHLVCLLEDRELRELQIVGLEAEARQSGISFHRFPVADGTVPRDPRAFAQLVSDIRGWSAAGENVVIHCKGGLGRAGTAGGCVLRMAGFDGDEALATLHQARGPSCPETPAQRDFIRAFVGAQPNQGSGVAGAVLGAAIGDAMGHPTEFLSMRDIHRKYGPTGVEGFELWWERDGARFAPYTDDTQMAEIVLRALVTGQPRSASMDDVMRQIAAGFVEWSDNPQGGHRAPGNGCISGAARLKDGVPWVEAGGIATGGCGSVMRAYPFGLVFGDDVERAETWAVEHSKMTHRAPIALAACAAMAVGTALSLARKPDATVFTAMIEAAGRHDSGTSEMIARAYAEAGDGTAPEVTLDRLRGWAAHEAIAAAVYVAARHPRDPRAAILEGANTPGDSDSIATLAGALVGARTGLDSWPSEWVRDVERSAELLGLASEAAEGIKAG